MRNLHKGANLTRAAQILIRFLSVVLAILLFGTYAVASDPNNEISDSSIDPAKQIDTFTGNPRVLVLTDIGNEPDDQMSLVRLLVYSNELEIEGLVATTSTWLRDKVNPDTIHKLLNAYGEVETNLRLHDRRFPFAANLRKLVRAGQPAYGMEAVGKGKLSEGARLLIEAVDKDDPRPLWVSVWGGANTLAQALLHVQETRSTQELAAFVEKLRVYTISDQDDAGPWIRRNFPELYYVGYPSNPSSETYANATWTGIAGDRMYKNGDGADFTTVTNPWLDKHIRSKGPLGAVYPHYYFIMEGDTPSFMNLLANGMAAHQNPSWGGWGGRYIYRTPYGESSPFWTQGSTSHSPTDSSKDTVQGKNGETYTSNQATIWRWREAFQHDFAARMDWTILSPTEANHPPQVMVNDEAGINPIQFTAKPGESIILSAEGTSDPDGNGLTYTWFYYREAGFGGPLQITGDSWAAALKSDEPWQALVADPRVEVEAGESTTARVKALLPGQAHVILAVEDNGVPSLTSYRRIIVEIADDSAID